MRDLRQPITDADKNGRQYLLSSDGDTVWVAHWNKLTRTWPMGAISWPEDMPFKCIPTEYPPMTSSNAR